MYWFRDTVYDHMESYAYFNLRQFKNTDYIPH